MLYVLICGLDSERFRRHLLEMDMLDFNKAIQLCQLIEATAVDLQHWTETKDPESVAAVSAKAGCMGVSEKPEEDENQDEDVPVLLIRVEKVSKKLWAESYCQGKEHKMNKLLRQLDSAASCNVLSYQDYCTIVDIGSSPCQCLFSRRTLGGVVTSVAKLQPQVQEEMWQRKLEKQQQIQARRVVDQNPLPPLTVGQGSSPSARLVIKEDTMDLEGSVWVNSQTGHTWWKWMGRCCGEITHS
ncbi:hypothetical protein EMCRGX_G027956 [Ephydatia muelleri]